MLIIPPAAIIAVNYEQILAMFFDNMSVGAQRSLMDDAYGEGAYEDTLDIMDEDIRHFFLNPFSSGLSD